MAPTLGDRACSAGALVRGAERTPVLRRRHADLGAEVVAQQRGGAEAGAGRDGLDRRGRCSPAACARGAVAGPAATCRAWCRSRRRSGGRRCAPTSLRGWASTRTGCSSARCSRIQVSSGERLSALQSGTGQVDVLALAAVALRRHHHPAGDLVGDRGAELAADVVQARVDAGRGAGAGDHPVVLDEEHVRVDVARGKRRLSSSVCTPVRGAGASVQQAGLAEQEGARADREHPGAARVRPAEDVEHRLGGRLRLVVGRGDHQVGALGSRQPVAGWSW